MKQMNIKKALLLAFFIIGVSNLQAKDIPYEVNKLPNTAQTFLKDHFSTYKVAYVIKDEGVFRSEYDVVFDNRTKVEFDNDGNWREVDGEDYAIPTAFIPAPILTYIKDKYPNMSVTKIEKGKKKYEVELNGDLDMEFDLQGNFLRID